MYHSLAGTEFCAWTEDYQGEKDIEGDLARDGLFCLKNAQGTIVGVISIDLDEAVENLTCWTKGFSKELRDVSGYSSIHISEFLTFADFVFDGFLADVLVQSKISEAKKQCDDAIRQVSAIRREPASKL